MSHEVESMAYAGQVPWHGLGVRVNNDLSPEQMMKAAGLDWTVKARQAYVTIGEKRVKIPRFGLTRSSDDKVLTTVSKDWIPTQNIDAFKFFKEFVDAGHMEMHTAGSLKGGQIVWILAKISESFEALKNDTIDSYLLFTVSHVYGLRDSIRSTQTRVVCNNTLNEAHIGSSKRIIKCDHRVAFDPEMVKDALELSAQHRKAYKEAALFLAGKRATDQAVKEYFAKLFPIGGRKDGASANDNAKNGASKNAELAYSLLNVQPGAEFARGTWWQALNAVTYMVDHKLGKTQDTRVTGALIGWGSNKKNEALALATKLAA